jgi:hypothetical protein
VLNPPGGAKRQFILKGVMDGQGSDSLYSELSFCEHSGDLFIKRFSDVLRLLLRTRISFINYSFAFAPDLSYSFFLACWLYCTQSSLAASTLWMLGRLPSLNKVCSCGLLGRYLGATPAALPAWILPVSSRRPALSRSGCPFRQAHSDGKAPQSPTGSGKL